MAKVAPAVKAADKAPSVARQKLLLQAQQHWAQVGKTTLPVSSKPAEWEPVASTVTLPSEQHQGLGAVGEEGYRHILAAQLQQQLTLPEHGSVTVSLTIDAAGHLIKYSLTAATSVRNRSYIEQALPQLDFPPLKPYISALGEHTLQLTLVGQ
jgi:hypothetical protein